MKQVAKDIPAVKNKSLKNLLNKYQHISDGSLSLSCARIY